MKRAFITFLAVCLLLMSLSGCNASNNPDETASNGAASENTLVLKLANGLNVTESASLSIAYFADYIEEHTNGAITFDRYLGGTLCSLPEEFSLCSSGAIDVCTLLQDMAINAVPYINIPAYATGGYEAGDDYYNAILFDDPEISQMVKEQAAKSNVIFLGAQTGGKSAYVCRKPFTGFADLSQHKFGTNRTMDVFESVGLQAVSVAIPDTYDSLSRGVCDASCLGLSAMMANKWYEVAPYVMVSNLTSDTNFFTVNLDTWNKLTEEQQQIFYDAAAAAADYIIQLNEEMEVEAEQVITDNGGTFGYFTEEDDAKYNQSAFTVMAAAAQKAADAIGDGENMTYILNACADYLGLEYEP